MDRAELYSKVSKFMLDTIRCSSLAERDKLEEEFVEYIYNNTSHPEPQGMKFCGQCTYLSVTEEEQNSNKKDEIHFCNLFKKRVLHFNQHPNLPRLDECKIIGTR